MIKVIFLFLIMPSVAWGENACPSMPLKPALSGSDVIARGAVIITEIMADPNPAVSLPPVQYLELYNRTTLPVELEGCSLSSGNDVRKLPSFIIRPSEYVIVCKASDTLLFSGYGRTLGLKTFPYLTIGGSIVCLYDPDGRLIHGIEYSDKWYGDQLKADGGWSLEITDVAFPFFYRNNWSASVSRKGGTPGSPSSLAHANPDMIFTGLENVFPPDSMTLRLTFSEPVFDTVAIRQYLNVEGSSIRKVQISDPLFRELLVLLQKPLQRKKTVKALFTSPLSDFAGNKMDIDEFECGLPSEAVKGDILFNELLFNPFPGNPDYIEFYNNSSGIIDASRLIVVSVNDATGDTSSAVFLSQAGRCILPGMYYAVSTDVQKITDSYPSALAAGIHVISSLPSMPDDDGHLLLLNRELDLIDQVSYSDDMHYSLLSSTEGVALEKINTSASSSDFTSWHSASESSGWGTPGAPNSILHDPGETDEFLSIASLTITPDSDGNDDMLELTINPTAGGTVISVTIFDRDGYFIRKLAENILAGHNTLVTWDGSADDGSAAEAGLYIILLEYFDETGRTGRIKKVCTLLR